MIVMFLVGVISIQAGVVDDTAVVRVEDQLPAAPLETVHIEGVLGQRIDNNINGRLKHIPMDEILDGFRHRPGSHPWIGEHIGKWLHAAVNAWRYSGDGQLKNMIDGAVRELLATQMEDGYLGTYAQKDRWTSWDVWVHKYNLIGLMTYYRATGDAASLQAARRIGDLLVATFGPDKRDIIKAGTHVGMAATSILEPMVYLYRATGDKRYLEFCHYLVESWDQPHGPKILSGLLSHGKVNKVANAKAYEMMSNLVGLCELYRVTADERYLQAARVAWDDIYANQVYITGGTSLHELFQPDGHLPDARAVAETCANVTWMQLSVRLLALTGEPKYADAIEQLVYNHLLGAQAEDGQDWCYFTVLKGHKQFRGEVNCCHSSGPRGVSLIPSVFYGRSEKRLRINLYGPSRFRGEVPGVGMVEVRQQTDYPGQGRINIEVRPEKPASFKLELRIPPWSKTYSLAVNDESVISDQRLAVIERQWHPGDVVALELDVAPQWIRGTGEHLNMLAARKGPFILCASTRWNPNLPPFRLCGVKEPAVFHQLGNLGGVAEAEKNLLTAIDARILTPDGVQGPRIFLGPFAMVQKETFVVWLTSAQDFSKARLSLLFGGKEGYSRRGNVIGSIADDDIASYRVTFDGMKKDLDWYEIVLDRPVEIQEVVFHHGHTFHDGGWFDTSSGKPEVLVQTVKNGPWKLIGKLESYPQTTADKRPWLTDGKPFELTIEPMKVFGIRVAGKPACGDSPGQSFSSCAELAAYGRPR